MNIKDATAAMKRYALRKGLIESQYVDFFGKTRVVYEATPGAYARWLESSGRKMTAEDPLPLPALTVVGGDEC
jgi:hypothetical protein